MSDSCTFAFKHQDDPPPRRKSGVSAATIKNLENEISAELQSAATQIHFRYYEKAWPHIHRAIELREDLEALKGIT